MSRADDIVIVAGMGRAANDNFETWDLMDEGQQMLMRPGPNFRYDRDQPRSAVNGRPLLLSLQSTLEKREPMWVLA